MDRTLLFDIMKSVTGERRARWQPVLLYKEAKTFEIQVMEVSKRGLGEEHLSTLSSIADPGVNLLELMPRARGVRIGGEKEGIGRGASRHPDQHGLPGFYLEKSGSLSRALDLSVDAFSFSSINSAQIISI